MKKDQGNERQEMHPLFPSGDWEGFYTYAAGSQADKHAMHFTLDFKDNAVVGSGADDVGGFSWKGTYNKVQLECIMTKHYSTHNVYYRGQVDENGIWGTWRMAWLTGGFHIWPKADMRNQEVQETEVQEEFNVL